MVVSTVFPLGTTATPVGGKRKLDELIGLATEGEQSHVVSPTTAQHSGPSAKALSDQNVKSDHEHSDDVEEYEDQGDNDEDDEEEEDLSLIDDILDQVEIEPYVHDGSCGLSVDQAIELRNNMQQVGLAKFVQDAIENDEPSLQHIGIALGLPPGLHCDDGVLAQILNRAIERAYAKRHKLPQFNTIDDAANLLKTSRNILVITGAGISTSLGIPDFRSKGTGFYEKIRELGFEDPQDVFDIHSFDENPQTFYSLAGDILPDQQRFTPTHAFIRLLQDQNRLQTNYTQNIDNLETLAGIDPDRLIQCHGSFATATCRKCRTRVPGSDIFADIRAQRIAYCTACTAALSRQQQQPPPPPPRKRARSRRPTSFSDSSSSSAAADDDIPQPGVMKPDITFFGEALPAPFFDRFRGRDAAAADLVLVLGTSLQVAPVSEIPNALPHGVPHIFVSREPIKHVDLDIQLLGNCDDVVLELCRRAGWELRHEMIPEGWAVEVRPDETYPHFWTVCRKAGGGAGGAGDECSPDGGGKAHGGGAEPSGDGSP